MIDRFQGYAPHSSTQYLSMKTAGLRP